MHLISGYGFLPIGWKIYYTTKVFYDFDTYNDFFAWNINTLEYRIRVRIE